MRESSAPALASLPLYFTYHLVEHFNGSIMFLFLTSRINMRFNGSNIANHRFFPCGCPFPTNGKAYFAINNSMTMRNFLKVFLLLELQLRNFFGIAILLFTCE